MNEQELEQAQERKMAAMRQEITSAIGRAMEQLCYQLDALGIKYGVLDESVLAVLRTMGYSDVTDDYETWVLDGQADLQ